MDAIKKKLTLGVLVLCLAGGGIPALAQQMDPALTATVIAQTTELKNIHKKRKKTQEKIIAAEAAVTVALDRVHSVEDKMLNYLSNAQTTELKNIHKKRKKTQEKIIAAEAAVTVALDRVHSVEDKMLNYLSNAQGAMQNLYQIKRAGELVAKEIPQNCNLLLKSVGSNLKGNCNLLLKSVGSNLKGTAIAAMVSDELADAATQMAALYPFMKQLVTSGKYDVTGADGKNEKHKVNLLNSSERYYIANEVVSRLEAINTDLFILAWQVRTLSWNDLWFSLDPEGWANVMSGKNIIGGIVAEWNQGYLLKW